MPITPALTLVERAKARIETLSLDEAKARADREEAVLVDIRDIRELDREGRIPGAIHAPRGMLEFWVDPDSPYHKPDFASGQRFVLFCDDLSFDGEDAAYKSLKAVLEGGVEGRPENVLFYATSNRRHLMPRDMIENERSTAINPSEAVEEKVSLSDRFGLWLGFHNTDQKTYLAMIRAYVEAYDLPASEEEWKPQAIEWAVTRGARSGRVAWQFVQDLAGRKGTTLNNGSN